MKDFLKPTKAMDIYCEHAYFMRNVKERLLGRWFMIPDRILAVCREMKNTGNI